MTETPLQPSSVTNLKELVPLLFPHHISLFLLCLQTLSLIQLKLNLFFPPFIHGIAMD